MGASRPALVGKVGWAYVVTSNLFGFSYTVLPSLQRLTFCGLGNSAPKRDCSLLVFGISGVGIVAVWDLPRKVGEQGFRV